MAFQETQAGKHPGWMKPIRELGVTIAGTELEAVLERFKRELHEAGIKRLQPSFYLSDEWGVPFDTTAIAIPFYLARSDLTGLHAQQIGFVEGATPRDLLCYLRHEMGHVVNYGYRLYTREDWVSQFGSIDQPYVEEYRPEPFHPNFVQHLPGWYAQKHPDEDWAETFAVWLTPALDWRKDYASRPSALAKLEYCDQVMKELADRDPLVTNVETDEAVEEMKYSLKEYYGHGIQQESGLPPGLDGSLRLIFDDSGLVTANEADTRPASALLYELESQLLADVYRWTGHFPERTRLLLRQMAKRADELGQKVKADHELQAALKITTLVTALAMNHVHHGSYARDSAGGDTA